MKIREEIASDWPTCQHGVETKVRVLPRLVQARQTTLSARVHELTDQNYYLSHYLSDSYFFFICFSQIIHAIEDYLLPNDLKRLWS